MSVSDILSLASQIVAALALLISLFTFIYTVVIGPQLTMVIGGDLQLFYSFNRKLVLVTDFAFFTGGARAGAILEFSGTLTLPISNQEISLRCSGPGGGKGTSTGDVPDSMPQPFIIPGRGVSGAETMKAFFITKEPFDLNQIGSYTPDLQVRIGPSLTRQCQTRITLALPDKRDLQFLDEKCREKSDDGLSDAALQLQRSALSRRGLISGWLRPPTPTFIPVAHVAASAQPHGTSSSLRLYDRDDFEPKAD